MRQSFAARARRRNAAAKRRNDRTRAANPLFAQAGLLDQVVALEDEAQWDALRIAYDEIARGVAQYVWWTNRAETDRRKEAIYVAMLEAAIGAENVEEVLADYDQRWPANHSMQQPAYRLSYLNTYLATYLTRTPLDIFTEAQTRRLATFGPDPDEKE